MAVSRAVESVGRAAQLAGHRIFRGLPERDISLLSAMLHERALPRNVNLFSSGDPGDSIYIVKSGFLRLHRLTPDGQEFTVSVVGAGNLFGEGALLDATQRSAFASTMTDVVLWGCSALRFARLIRASPPLALRIMHEVLRMHERREAYFSLSTYARAKSRVEIALLRLAEAYGVRLADGSIWAPVRLTHREIASLAGTARETATGQLSSLKREGLLRTERDGSFVLPNVDCMASRTLDRPFRLDVDEPPRCSSRDDAVGSALAG